MEHLDTTGLLCPLPVLKLRKRLKSLEIGAKIKMDADDHASQIDVPHFCNEAGHTLVAASQTDAVFHYVVRKGG